MIFEEAGTVPTSMIATRVLLAAAALNPDCLLLQSDCVRAYVQADLVGTNTFISLPPAWWPLAWRAAGLKRPVCRLRKALYGHPQAGDLWAERLGAALRGRQR